MGKALARLEAWHFLTDRAGGWAIARRAWCELADIPPDSFETGVALALARRGVTHAALAAEHEACASAMRASHARAIAARQASVRARQALRTAGRFPPARYAVA